MRTVSVRELRGNELTEYARKGELVGIKSNRALIGVIIPVTPTWVEHLIDQNLSRLRASVAEGEDEIKRGQMMSVDALLASEPGRTRGSSSDAEPAPAPLRFPVERVLKSVVGKSQDSDANRLPVRTVRVGDLSGREIELAGEMGQTLALTNDRVLIGIVVPVTPGLVEFLVEENITRVMYNITCGEQEIASQDSLTTLEQVRREAADHRSAAP